ncbi:hypothetical protein [Granulicoccus phenolivorans]|uniref:hypothetical protein n=1 Tax=Granulicoccus phenolivorans TaxID=266854 RepID=UPI0011AE819D|nr:hypothetical protein [Granulicoccus phenolivorans]
MFSSFPLVSLVIAAGTSEQIVVRRIETVVYEKKQFDHSRTYTRVACIHGGGFNPGYFAGPIIGSGVTEVTEGLNGDPQPMPPGTITVRDEGIEILISPKGGESDFIFSGAILVSYEINGEKRAVQYGSGERPYRWTNASLSSTTPSLDWDERDGRWKTMAEVSAHR